MHQEAFLRIWEEREAEILDLTKKYDTYKLLSEKLQTYLLTTQDEHAEMTEQIFLVFYDSKDELYRITIQFCSSGRGSNKSKILRKK